MSAPNLLSDGNGGYYAQVPGGQYRVREESETYALVLDGKVQMRRAPDGNFAPDQFCPGGTLPEIFYRTFWRATFAPEPTAIPLPFLSAVNELTIYTGDSFDDAKRAVAEDDQVRSRIYRWAKFITKHEPPGATEVALP